MNRRARLTSIAVVLLVAACSKPSGGGGTTATSRPPDPTPTAAPWTIDVESVTYSTKARLAGSMTVTAVIKNTGKAKNPSIEFQFNGISDYADIVGCTPDCETDDGFAGVTATVPGIAPGKKKTIEIEFIPTAIGAAHWDVCIYDDAQFGNQVWCGTGTTTVR